MRIHPISHGYSDAEPTFRPSSLGKSTEKISESPTSSERQLITVSTLAALGNAKDQLAFHFGGALQVGCTPEELKEAILIVSVYAGFPTAFNAAEVLRNVISKA